MAGLTCESKMRHEKRLSKEWRNQYNGSEKRVAITGNNVCQPSHES
uniref:Uncharacterized protein n=1 Tax=Rhizophora mucronata TaxID=61149 RepID=A0A2P2N818_RHIMU